MAIKPVFKYQADDASIHALRLSPETGAAAGTEPTGAIDSSIKAKLSKSNRAFGIRPRKVILSRIVGSSPNEFRIYKDLPVFTVADYNDAAYAIGASITVGTFTWQIVSKSGEDY